MVPLPLADFLGLEPEQLRAIVLRPLLMLAVLAVALLCYLWLRRASEEPAPEDRPRRRRRRAPSDGAPESSG
jgi:hypothetical protein